MAATQQQCSVIRVDKKTSLLVYRDANVGESILTNGNEVLPSTSFTSTLKSIFSNSSSNGNIFSAEAASIKQENERKKMLGSGAGAGMKASGSPTNSNAGGSEGSPKVAFAPLPDCERPRGRACSLSMGVSGRAALLRGETPTGTPRETVSPSSPKAPQVIEPEETESPFEPEEEEEEEECRGRGICRNSTITKENINQVQTSSGSAAEEKEGKWSDKLRKSFKRRSSSTSSAQSSASSAPAPSPTLPNNLGNSQGKGRRVVYEVVSNTEADSLLSKGKARRGTADLKVVQEQGEEEWLEEAVAYDPLQQGLK